MKKILVAIVALAVLLLAVPAAAQVSGQTGTFNRLYVGQTALAPYTTLTCTNMGQVTTRWYKWHWNNGDVTALDTTTTTQTGNIKLGTLPAGCIVKRAIIHVDSAASGVTTLTISCGIASSAYVDYILAASAKSVAWLGDANSEEGASLKISTTGQNDSFVATASDVYLQFITTTGSEYLHSVLTSSGTVYLEIETLP